MRNRLGNAWWIAVGFQIVLAAVIIIAALPLLIDESWAREAGDPNWIQRNRNAARQLMPYLLLTLKLGVAGAIILPVVCTLAWFAYLWTKRVEVPGEARKAFAIWLALLSFGVVICVIFGGLLLQSSYLQLLLNGDMSDIFYRIKPPAQALIGGAILAYFLISYFIATLVATPALFRTAVPMASRVSVA